MVKVLFLTTAHRYDDDRIFHHQAKELVRKGFEVKICSLSSEFKGDKEGISIDSFSILAKSSHFKTETFRKIIEEFQPECIIASEPLAIISAKNYVKDHACSLIYDITEWYPSKRMLSGFSAFFRPIHFVKFFLIQLYAGWLCTHFIFGEKTKMFPLDKFFPWKPHIILPYFPDERYIHKSQKVFNPKKITLCYTGVFSKEKGIENFLNSANAFRRKRPDINLSLLLIGTSKKGEEDFFSQLLQKFKFENITVKQSAKFEDFTKSYSDADICFDLREKNFENDRCLPIKIFYYAATGKPVIYTDLAAIHQHIDIAKFGFTVNPADFVLIANLIESYIDNPALYRQHSENASALFHQKYNWNQIREIFVNFVVNSFAKK